VGLRRFQKRPPTSQRGGGVTAILIWPPRNWGRRRPERGRGFHSIPGWWADPGKKKKTRDGSPAWAGPQQSGIAPIRRSPRPPIAGPSHRSAVDGTRTGKKQSGSSTAALGPRVRASRLSTATHPKNGKAALTLGGQDVRGPSSACDYRLSDAMNEFVNVPAFHQLNLPSSGLAKFYPYLFWPERNCLLGLQKFKAIPRTMTGVRKKKSVNFVFKAYLSRAWVAESV